MVEEHSIIGSSQNLARTHTWGTDLSGSLQGAGGLLLTEEIDGSTATSYHYGATHQALQQIAFSVNDTPVLYGNLQYDPLLQLRRISYHNGDLEGTLKTYSDFQYTRNDLGTITSITTKDRSKQLVGYNPAGEVVKTEHLLDANGTDKRQGGSFAWTYDGIGNRLSASRGGDSAGANLRSTTYRPNALNQYVSITNPGAVDVSGRAPATDTVSVNGDPTSRQGERFHQEVSADNSGGPVWKEIIVANGTDSIDGFSLIPPVTQTPTHDADGNLTQDGVYQYVWDAENRLIKIETLAAAVNAGVPYQRVENLYDSNWRRIQRLRYDQPAGAAVEHTRYLWAGWRCLGEVNGSGELSKTFVWGLDSRQNLSLGDSNGALLWTNDLTAGQRHFCHYDGNGNVTGLSDATGAQTAEYLYNAFGELLERRGEYADENLYRFSTKPFEEVGGLYYYGYRFYDPQTGRWPSRDPLDENGGLNIMGFVNNSPFSWLDLLGRESWGLFYDQNGNWMYPHGLPKPPNVQPDPTIVMDISEGLEQFLNNYLTEAISVNTYDKAIKIIELKKNRCGGCLESIAIYSHGEEGTMYLTGGDEGIAVTGESMERINSKAPTMTNDDRNISELFKRLKSALCSGGKIKFYSCHAGAGVGGQKLERELTKYFGQDVVLPKAFCRPAIPRGVEYDDK